jgi:hypothetical protein
VLGVQALVYSSLQVAATLTIILLVLPLLGSALALMLRNGWAATALRYSREILQQSASIHSSLTVAAGATRQGGVPRMVLLAAAAALERLLLGFLWMAGVAIASCFFNEGVHCKY